MATYQPVDRVRSIPHGVSSDGRALRLMPSEDDKRLTDADMVSLVAYVRQLPAQSGREQGIVQLPVKLPRLNPASPNRPSFGLFALAWLAHGQ
nr:hypothetical protein [uncultured Roseateles sp.]